MSIQELPDLLEMAHVCRLLHIHPNTFRSGCNSGRLPAVKIGGRWYVPKSELMKMLEVDK